MSRGYCKGTVQNEVHKILSCATACQKDLSIFVDMVSVSQAVTLKGIHFGPIKQQ